MPGSGHQSLGTCIFSYAGDVWVGFKVDAAAIPDPEHILKAFHDEVDALPDGHALLIVQRGPGAGSRFLLSSSTAPKSASLLGK